MNHFGYINFGVSDTKADKPGRNHKVIVIGAGISGLTASKQLVKMGFHVILLEGRDRIGGRIHSQSIGTKNGMKCLVELGADVTTGTSGNLLHLLCKQKNIQTKIQNQTCPLYSDWGYIQPQVEKDIETHFQELTSCISEYRNQTLTQENSNLVDVSLHSAFSNLKNLKLNLPNLSENDKTFRKVFLSALSWHEACLEYGIGSALENVSLRYWDQDDAYEMIGSNWYPVGGFSKVLELLLPSTWPQNTNQQDEKLPNQSSYQLYLNKIVHSISYFKDQNVNVHCTDGSEFHGDAVLLTVPLGVLQKR